MKHPVFIAAQGLYHSYLYQSSNAMTSSILENSFDLQNLVWDLEARGMSPQHVEQFEALVASCWDKGVDVVLDPSLQDSYGTYNPHSNELTLGANALDCNIQLVETMEHEFIHVLQDEVAGIHNGDMEALGLPTTSYAENMVDQGYSHLDDHIQALELEAFTGEQMMNAGG